MIFLTFLLDCAWLAVKTAIGCVAIVSACGIAAWIWSIADALRVIFTFGKTERKHGR